MISSVRPNTGLSQRGCWKVRGDTLFLLAPPEGRQHITVRRGRREQLSRVTASHRGQWVTPGPEAGQRSRPVQRHCTMPS